MKIEMAESLGASWLKHVKNCAVVQTNWKPSPIAEIKFRREIDSLYESLKDGFRAESMNVFKKNHTVEQLLRQTECDVLGIAFGNEGSPKWYALEVAFHEEGLNYGSKEVTIAKVAAKLTRAALCIYAFMGVRSANIIFASPRVNPAVEQGLRNAISVVRRLFIEKGFGFSFELLLNDKFCNDLLVPMAEAACEISDTSELFVRSMQLCNMFSIRKKVGGGTRGIRRGEAVDASHQTSGVDRIGKYVQAVMPGVLEELSEEEMANLQDKEWCKETFGLHYAMIVPEGSRYDRARYYRGHVVVGGRSYHLTNDWYPRNRGPLDAWIAGHSRENDQV